MALKLECLRFQKEAKGVRAREKGLMEAMWEADERGLIPGCCLTSEGGVPATFKPLVLPLKNGEIRVGEVRRPGWEKCLWVDEGPSILPLNDDLTLYPDQLVVTQDRGWKDLGRIMELEPEDFDWGRMTEEERAAAVIWRKKMFPTPGEKLAQAREQFLATITRAVSGLSVKVEKPAGVEKPTVMVEPIEDESRRLAIEKYDLERERLEVARIQFEVDERERMLEREEQKNEVAGVARGWLKILEQRGIKLEGLPERWNMEHQQMHMVLPGVEFELCESEWGGIVEIGRWKKKELVSGLERKSEGITMEIRCGFGSQARIWLIDLDQWGRAVYFSDNYLARGYKGVLQNIRFTGDRYLGKRSEQVAAELVR